MDKPSNAVDHPALLALLPLLGADQERDHLATLSTDATARATALDAEVRAMAARAAATERTKLATERQHLETEFLFAPGRLEVATANRVRAELAYLAHVAGQAADAAQAAVAAHERTHAAWIGPATRDYELSNTTEPETLRARALLKEQLAPLTAANADAARTVDRLSALRQLCTGVARMQYGEGVELARPATWEPAARAAGTAAAATWRTGRRDLTANGAQVAAHFAPLTGGLAR
jgi:hypothetical protein